VTKRYGDRTALESVDLEVAPGEIVGLLGPNGAGKTTLVEVVTGLRRPDAGTVFVSGSDVVRNPRVARRLIGFAPQDLGIYPRATVAENLKFFAGLAGLSRRQAALRAEEVSRAMGLASLSERRAHTLSGGQKHRLHAAAAIAHRPPLLLLDEPTVGSDIETRQMLLDVVRGLAAEGTAVVYTTHYLPELEVLGATIAILEGGRIVARGTQDSLIRRYGGAALKLVFDGPAPELPDAESPRSGSLLRVEADDPAGTAVSILARLGPHARRLQSIDIVRPGLEASTWSSPDVAVRRPRLRRRIAMRPESAFALIRHNLLLAGRICRRSCSRGHALGAIGSPVRPTARCWWRRVRDRERTEQAVPGMAVMFALS
jgi:ABC-2 type transport system ATP-binding protein